MILKNNNEPYIIGDGNVNLYNFSVNNNPGINVDVIKLLNIDQHSPKTVINFQYNPTSSIRLENGQVLITGQSNQAILEQIPNLISLQESCPIQPNLLLIDQAKTAHREFMLDIARNYIPLDEIKRIVDELFRNRINYFHLHISDDQNYGIESRVHPELNTKPHLSINELKELIQYCSCRGIEIIPEFDVPGHSFHLLETNPNLRCNPQKGNSICFAKNHDYIFELIDEICSIFPGKYFHIGADELGIKNQYQCPDCKELMHKKGYQSPKQLAADFINEVALYVQKIGKTPIAWNDSLRYGQIDQGVIIQKWFNYAFDRTCLEEALKGRPIIISSATDTYFSGPYSLTPLSKTYNYIPEIKDVPMPNPFGLSSHLWTESIVQQDDVEKHLFPRIQAFGENAWCEASKLDYRDFLIRIRIELERLRSRGIDSYSLDDVDSFSIKETSDFLNKKMHFKNYTDFGFIDLLKMTLEYRHPRRYQLQRKRTKNN